MVKLKCYLHNNRLYIKFVTLQINTSPNQPSQWKVPKMQYSSYKNFDRMVDSKEFREIFRHLHPRYQVPDRKAFSVVVVPQIHYEVKLNVTIDLAKAEQVS